MSIAVAVKHMMAAGMSAEAIVAAVAEMEASMPKARTAGAIRQERYRRNTEAKRLSDKDWYPLVGRVLKRDGFKCHYCGSTEKLGADHVVPLSRGGSNDIGNLVACCESCNKSKGGRLVEEWRDPASQRHGSVTTRHSDVCDAAEASRVEDNLLPSKQDKPSKEKTPKGVQKKGSRIPADWQPDCEEAAAIGLSEAQTAAEAAKFRDYWTGKAGKEALKADWPATWRNWCRNAVERRPPIRLAQTGPPPPRPKIPDGRDFIKQAIASIESQRHDDGSQFEATGAPIRLLASSQGRG